MSRNEPITNFEDLPNEILLDVFAYFTGIDLLRTFYGLNTRLNNVLHEQFEDCSFQFNAVSKRDFDVICQQHLFRMADYILNLQLSDNEETPTEIEQFLFYSPSFDRFTQLQSLSLSDLRSYPTLIKTIEQCHHLDNLTHLNLFNCFFPDDQVDFQWIIDHIWSLANLTHCTIGIGIKGHSFRIPTRISSSLRCLSIEKIQIKLNQINQLIEHTPHLTSLSISVLSFNDNDYTPAALPTLTELSINSLVTCNASNMATFLQNTPNLIQLNIDLLNELVDGNQWEEIIRTHLPNLVVFRLRMKVIVPATQNIQVRVDALINSFETPFWIDEHQWFIHCLIQNRTIYLYTLSKHYEGDLPIVFRSTSHEHDEQDFYNRMTKLTSPTFFDQPIPSYIRMTKIKHLGINLPLTDRFRSIIPNFNRLTSLTVYFHADTFHFQLQNLFDHAPHLYKLSINQHSSTLLQRSIFKYRCSSIRELDLLNIYHYFDEDNCIALSHSPLGLQCEVLSILVYDCQSIITLVENMPKLRALNVRCQNERFSEQSSINDDCIQWLKKYLPSRCVVVRPPKLTCNILVWI